jgi:uncharacterized protein with NRDE domain
LPVHWWRDGSGVLGGRDCLGGGTWLCLRPAAGRWAAVTNYFEPLPLPGAPARPSRGALPLHFAGSDAPPLAHLRALAPSAPAYAGFNLLCGDTTARSGAAVAVLGNRGAAAARGAAEVPPSPTGVHALSNGVFGDEWPKVAAGRAALCAILDAWTPGAEPPVEALLTRLLGDTRCAEGLPDEQLPRTCVTLEEERALAPPFVAMDSLLGGGRCVRAHARRGAVMSGKCMCCAHACARGAPPLLRCSYGTRSSVVVLVRRDGDAHMTERLWEPAAAAAGDGIGCGGGAAAGGSTDGAWRTHTLRFRMAVGGVAA